MEKTLWLVTIEEKFLRISERRLFDNALRYSLSLDIILDVARKVEIHSNDCAECQKYKANILKYLEEIESFLDENPMIEFVDDINISNQNRLQSSYRANLRPIRNHLLDEHGHYLRNAFRVRFTFYSILISIILFFLNLSYWPLASSIILVMIGYLAGDIVNGQYEKKGRMIQVFDFRKAGLLAKRPPFNIRDWFLGRRD
ncbi:hypothetical protein [Microscilla marina]|uniref:Uncharacterized protein n=1 Tax=Microscilla marina ATCC 23134 TaxID=313606 RepID=A1ZUQ0_MICM2|nr:hypothetical protein [Microscilla marina]EAY25936.1 hypothetical protein M23134_00890 [Microscilla marina ATCC 23134]